MKPFVVLMALLIGCASGRDSLPDGEPLPDGTGLVVGEMDFSTKNWKEVASVRAVGGQKRRLEPSTQLFGIPLPPGRYRLEHFSFYEPENMTLFFDVKEGEAVYIGSWTAQLNQRVELRDNSPALAAEIERRWGIKEVAGGLPAKPGVIQFVFDARHPDAPRSISY
ncbi:MAG: hypothetical protein ACYTHK_08095 [Planctomycetota bacterium]